MPLRHCGWLPPEQARAGFQEGGEGRERGRGKERGRGGGEAIQKESFTSHIASILSHPFHQKQITKSGPHSTGGELLPFAGRGIKEVMDIF